jgi:hypothetical protein
MISKPAPDKRRWAPQPDQENRNTSNALEIKSIFD